MVQDYIRLLGCICNKLFCYSVLISLYFFVFVSCMHIGPFGSCAENHACMSDRLVAVEKTMHAYSAAMMRNGTAV